MAKAPRNQSTIDDLFIEDGELAEALQEVTLNELAATTYRGARKRVKDRLTEHHGAAINAKTADGRDRYVVVDGHRFLAKTATRPAGKNPPRAGVNWRLDVHKIITPEAGS